MWMKISSKDGDLSLRLQAFPVSPREAANRLPRTLVAVRGISVALRVGPEKVVPTRAGTLKAEGLGLGGKI